MIDYTAQDIYDREREKNLHLLSDLKKKEIKEAKIFALKFFGTLIVAIIASIIFGTC